jgi:hypothetical protein
MQVFSSRFGIYCLPVLILFFSLLPARVHANGETARLYISPHGSDSAPGTSTESPLATLLRAIQIGTQQPESGATTIIVMPGVYINQKVVITTLNQPLSIVPFDRTQPPIFSGGGEGTWMQVNISSGRLVPLTIEGIEVRRYQTAVSLNGNRNIPERWLGGVKLIGNRFVDIGSALAEQRPSTAAIRLVNARNSLIQNNQFRNIVNIRDCALLHAIYLAHMSINNVIDSNTFDGGCGDTIKVRDLSNHNRVLKNHFLNQRSNTLMIDSYCDKQVRSDCTKTGGECPSWGNIFENNTYTEPVAQLVRTITFASPVLSDLTRICPPFPADQKRITESMTIMSQRLPSFRQSRAATDRCNGTSLCAL